MTAITGSENISRVRLIALKGALRMEVRGMRRSSGRQSALSICREEGLTTVRTARGAYDDICKLLAVE